MQAAPFTGRIRHVGQDGYLPLQVTLDELADQHEAGWVDFHPEDFCHRCGNRNVSWAADSDVWGSVMGGDDPWHGIICMPCFTELRALVHGESGWSIVYDENGTVRLNPHTDGSDALRELIAEHESTLRRLRAHERLGLAAIFLADTFTSDADPDVEIRRIRDEWLAEQQAPLVEENRRLIAEMHQRELHHFETERLLTEAGIDPDTATTPPTDDDRTVLARVVGSAVYGDRDDLSRATKAADEVLAAGFRRHGPVTDEAVRAAFNVITSPEYRVLTIDAMRAALEAAEGARTIQPKRSEP
jgi:hypothetical protein